MKTSKFSLVLAALAVVMIAVGTLTGEAPAGAVKGNQYLYGVYRNWVRNEKISASGFRQHGLR